MKAVLSRLSSYVLIVLIGVACISCTSLQPSPPTLAEARRVEGVDSTNLIVSGPSALWCTDLRCWELFKIDPGTRKPLARMQMPATYAVEDLAVGHGAIWIASGGSEPAISKMDASSGRLMAQTTLAKLWGSKNKWAYVAVGEGAVWATVNTMDQLFRLDPVSGRITDRIPIRLDSLSDELHRLAAGEGGVWVLHQNLLTRVDPGSRREVARIAVPGVFGRVGEVSVGAGFVWVTTGSSLMKIDPRTNRIVARLPADWAQSPPSSPYYIGHPVIRGGTLYALAFQSVRTFADPTYGRYALIEVDVSSCRLRSMRKLGVGDISQMFFGPTVAVTDREVWVSQPTGLYVLPRR